jgi:hypothetical protein
MGRFYRGTVRHMAWAGGAACSKTAYPGYSAAEVGPVTKLTTGETALLPWLRFSICAVQGGVSPPSWVSGRAVCMACLTIKLRAETTHLRDPPLQIAAVALIAHVPVAHESCPVIYYPIGGVLAGRINSGPAGMASLSVKVGAETTDSGYPPQQVAAVTPNAPLRVTHIGRPVTDDPIGYVLSG